MRTALLAAAILAVAMAGCSSPTSDADGMAADSGNVVTAMTDTHHGERFAPANLTIGVGETVTFHIASGFHTVDFQDTMGVSSPHQDNLAPGTDVKVTFSQPGTFRYYCQYHIPGMTGTVLVQ